MTPRRRALEPPFFPPILLKRARSLLFSSSRTHFFTFFCHRLKICAVCVSCLFTLRSLQHPLWHKLTASQ